MKKKKKNVFKLLKQGKITEDESRKMVFGTFIDNVEKQGVKNE